MRNALSRGGEHVKLQWAASPSPSASVAQAAILSDLADVLVFPGTSHFPAAESSFQSLGFAQTATSPMTQSNYQYDVIVIGAGHAGTEAAAASARLGARTALLTTNLDTVGQMSCNPAIGGVAKGQIVREVDALGGLMGRAIDATGIQFRLLNCRKGPAMHSPRAQADKKAYQQHIKLQIEQQPNLDLRQETVEDLLTESTGGRTRIAGVRVRGDACYHAPTVVLTTGTFLQAIMHTGDSQSAGGRAGEGTTAGISGALHRLGFQIERFKTGAHDRLLPTRGATGRRWPAAVFVHD